MSLYYIIAASAACITLVVTLLGTSVGVGIAYGVIKQRLISHEQQDKSRFDEIAGMLTEVRSDIKTLLTTR